MSYAVCDEPPLIPSFDMAKVFKALLQDSLPDVPQCFAGEEFNRDEERLLEAELGNDPLRAGELPRFQPMECLNGNGLVLRGHLAQVRSMCVTTSSLDSRTRIVTAGDDHAINVYFTDGKLDYTLQDVHKEGINCVSTCPDPEREGCHLIMTGSDDDTAKFWRLETRECLGSISFGDDVEFLCCEQEVQNDTVHIVAASRDNFGHSFWISVSDGRILVKDRVKTTRTEGFQNSVYGTSLLPGGNLAVAGGACGKLALWNTETGAIVDSVSAGDKGTLRKMATARRDPDGDILCALCTDPGHVQCYNIIENGTRFSPKLELHKLSGGSQLNVVIARDGETGDLVLATGVQDGILFLKPGTSESSLVDFGKAVTKVELVYDEVHNLLVLATHAKSLLMIRFPTGTFTKSATKR